MASSSVAPTLRDYSTRAITHEPIFDPESFIEQPHCKEAIKTIQDSDLKVFTKLPTYFYPRLVRKFYETLSVSSELTDDLRGEFAIDGKVYRFTTHDIAKALDIKKYKPINVDTHESTMRNELMFRPPQSNPRNVLLESYLHQDFWVVGKFMRHYACPFTKANEIPQFLFKFWHGMYLNDVIDVPALIVESMLMARDGGRSTLNPHNLVLPRTITAILKRFRHKIPNGEQREEATSVFNYEKLKKSLQALAVGTNLAEPYSKRRANQERRAKRQAEENVEEEEEQDMDTDEGGQDDWDQHVQYQGVSQSTWRTNAWTQGPPPQGNWGAQYYWPPRDQWEAHMSNQAQIMNNQNQVVEMMQGMSLQMGGMNDTMLGMQGTLNRLDSRVQSLEDRRWTGEAYQRRKHTIHIEEEHGGASRDPRDPRES